MKTVRKALLELITLQKQRISQLEVQTRYQQTELYKYSPNVDYSAFNAEIGDNLLLYGETWTLVSKDRNNETISIRRVKLKERTK